MAEEGRLGSLPVGWISKTEVHKDGSEIKYYTNVKTGQTFDTEKDLYRYVKYATETLPKLNAGWRMDFEGNLHPPEGGSKNRAVGESSSAPATAANAPLKDQPLEIEKQGEKNTKPGSKKAKNKNKKKRRGSK